MTRKHLLEHCKKHIFSLLTHEIASATNYTMQNKRHKPLHILLIEPIFFKYSKSKEGITNAKNSNL